MILHSRFLVRGLVVAKVMALASVAQGLTTHAPFAPFGVTTDPASTMLATTHGYNGSTIAFGPSFELSGVADAGWQRIDGTLVAHFQADPGYVFTAVGLSYGQWGYSNAPSFGGHQNSLAWSIPGSTYVGDTNPPEEGADTSSWTGSGSSGSAFFARYVWWDGGGNQFRQLMGPWGTLPIQLNGVSSFTLTVDSTIWVANNSGYGFSTLNATVDLVPVPEPSAWAVVPGVLALGLVGWRRARR